MKKAYNILISFVGSNDAGKTQGKNDGAILTVLKSKEFDEVHLLWTSSNRPDLNFDTISKYLQTEIKKRKYSNKIFRHYFELEDVIDHNEIYPKLKDFLDTNFKDTKAKLTAAIASGTPSMQACWILLAESGDFKIELIRSNEKWTGKPSVTQVKLGTGLPRIVHLEKEVKAMSPEVVMTIKHPSLKIDNNEIILGPLEFCYYRYFLMKAMSGEKYMKVSGFDLPKEFLEYIIKYHNESFPEQDQDILEYVQMLKRAEYISSARFQPNRSKINKKIRLALNNPTRSRYAEIDSEGMKNAKKYGINLPEEKINISR